MSLSETTSGRDSALGSASLVGEGSSFFQTEDEGASGGSEPPGHVGVSRSVSLPDQLGSLGAARLALMPAEAATQDGGAGGGAYSERRSGGLETADEDCDVRSISDSTPIQL